MTAQPTINRKGKARLAPTIASILFILIIGAIGVQTITSCSGGDDGNGGSSPSNGNNSSSSGADNGEGGGSVTYEGETYKTVVIGTQTWMAKNLNYNATGSRCYDGSLANCATYGRLYDWATAMALSSDCNSSSCANQIQPKHKGICPTGWHIPTNAEWNVLLKFVDTQNGGNGDDKPCETITCDEDYTVYSYTAGKYLKAASGWNWNDDEDISGNGVDKYEFSALPSGTYYYYDGSFRSVGKYGGWWAASEGNANGTYNWGMDYRVEYGGWASIDKPYGSSVRCLKD